MGSEFRRTGEDRRISGVWEDDCGAVARREDADARKDPDVFKIKCIAVEADGPAPVLFLGHTLGANEQRLGRAAGFKLEGDDLDVEFGVLLGKKEVKSELLVH